MYIYVKIIYSYLRINGFLNLLEKTVAFITFFNVEWFCSRLSSRKRISIRHKNNEQNNLTVI